MQEITTNQLMIAFVVYCVIMYIIVRVGVASGNFGNTKHLHDQLTISNNLKKIELQKQGVSQEEIDKACTVS